MIIAVDFDGVIIPAGHWPGLGEPNTALISQLAAMRERGHRLILWTNRTKEPLKLVVDFCKGHGLEFDAVNENLPETRMRFNDDSRKITADRYIDDKAVKLEFKGGDPAAVLRAEDLKAPWDDAEWWEGL